MALFDENTEEPKAVEEATTEEISAEEQAKIEQKQEAAEGKQAVDLLTKLNKGEKDA